MISTVFWQVVTMFILSAIGFILFKTKKLSQEAVKGIGNILIFLSLPCVIINGFRVEKTPERITGLVLSAVAALAVILLGMLISRIIFGRRAMENFAGSFSNPGFFGVPIIVASFGSGAVFYIASFIAFLNLLQWSYGVSLLKNSDDKGMLIKKESSGNRTAEMIASAKSLGMSLIKAPFMIAIIIGLILFFTQIQLPSFISNSIGHLAAVNTPLAMFTIGVYMAQTDIAGMFKKPMLYLVSATKLLIIPICAMGLLYLLPINNYDLKTCILIAAACPVGSNIAVYAQLNNKDYAYAVETVVVSTLFSIVTLPLIVALGQMVL